MRKRFQRRLRALKLSSRGLLGRGSPLLLNVVHRNYGDTLDEMEINCWIVGHRS